MPAQVIRTSGYNVEASAADKGDDEPVYMQDKVFRAEVRSAFAQDDGVARPAHVFQQGFKAFVACMTAYQDHFPFALFPDIGQDAQSLFGQSRGGGQVGYDLR